MTHPPTDLTRVIDRLRRSDAHDRADLVANEVIETGGTYTRPGGTLSHLFEISLHGIHATGLTEEQAIDNWMKCAARLLAASDLATHMNGAQA